MALVLTPDAPIASLALGVLAIAFASGALLAAFAERPPPARMPVAAVVLAAGWAGVFLIAGVLVARAAAGELAAGLLLAAGELSAAAAVWFNRSRHHGRGDDPPRGGWGDPDDPPPPVVPDDFWDRWEDYLSAAGGPHAPASPSPVPALDAERGASGPTRRPPSSTT